MYEEQNTNEFKPKLQTQIEYNQEMQKLTLKYFKDLELIK